MLVQMPYGVWTNALGLILDATQHGNRNGLIREGREWMGGEWVLHL
jgi:hypothetical protein